MESPRDAERFEAATEFVKIAQEVDRLRAERDKMDALYTLVANCAIQIDIAQNDGHPGKAASFCDEMVKLLADYVPSGKEFSALAADMRGRTWNSQIVADAEERAKKAEVEVTRLRAHLEAISKACMVRGDHYIIPRDVVDAAWTQPVTEDES